MTMPQGTPQVGSAKVAPPAVDEPPIGDRPAPPVRKVRPRIPNNRIEMDPANPRRGGRVLDPDGNPVPAGVIAQRRRALRTADDSDWLEADEWPKRRAVLICENPACPVHGVEIVAWLAENADGVYRSCCGGCGREHSGMYEADTDDLFPEEIEELKRNGRPTK